MQSSSAAICCRGRTVNCRAAPRLRRLRAQKSTFAVIFIIQKGKIRDDSTVPIVARITVNGEMVHFATRMYIHPDRWLPKDYRTAGKTKEEKQINEMLEELRVLIRRKYDEMLRREEVITAGKLKNAITGLARTPLRYCRFATVSSRIIPTCSKPSNAAAKHKAQHKHVWPIVEYGSFRWYATIAMSVWRCATNGKFQCCLFSRFWRWD